MHGGMLALFTAPDALVVVAIISTLSAAVGSWRNARKARQQSEATAAQMRPNGGKSARDALDRIEACVVGEVIPRLDHAAQVAAEHADRLAVLEARSTSSRTRSTDNPPQEG